MALYFVPADGDFSTLREVAEKAELAVQTPNVVREFILQSDKQPLAIVAVTPEMLLVINRHARQLLDEHPSVVIGVPNLIYTGEWMTLASTFPAIDWSELEGKLRKTGHTSHSAETLEKRSVGSVFGEFPSTQGDSDDEGQGGTELDVSGKNDG